MANNVFQVKRTSTSGRTPNTTSSGNSQYINAGELALNMTDQVLYTSDGTNLITVGSNVANQRVGNLTISAVTANGSYGSPGQALTTNGSSVYWSSINTNAASSYVWTNTHVFQANVTLTTVVANNSTGTTGQALTTNGSSVYWSTIVGTNTAAAYVWSNTHTFNANLTIGTASVIANGTQGNIGQILTSNGSGVYWGTGGGGGGYLIARQIYTANGSQNTFTVATGYSANNLDVYLNGVKLQNGVEANTLNGYTFTILGSNPVNGSIIEVVGMTSVPAAPYTFTTGMSVDISNNVTINAAYIATITANNAAYLGGTAASGYQTTAGLSANVVTLTANNAAYLGGTAAASYQLNSTLNANIAGYLPTYTGVVNAASLTTGATGLGTGGLIANVTTLFIGNNTVNAAINTTALYIGGNVIANSTGANNAFNLGGTIASSFVANTSGGLSQNTSGHFVVAGTGAVVNSTGVHVNATYIGTISANNASYLGGTAAASYVNTSGSYTLSGNLTFTGANIQLNSASLGGTATNYVNNFTFYTNAGNASYLRFYTYRFATGGDWTGVSTRLQQRIDVTDQGYLEFNPSGYSYGIGLYGSSSYGLTISQTGQSTFGNTVILGTVGVSANGSSGTSGQVLTSNGSSTYWSATANNANNLGGTAAASYALLANPTFTGTVTTPNLTVGNSTVNAVVNSTSIYWNSSSAGVVTLAKPSANGSRIDIIAGANVASSGFWNGVHFTAPVGITNATSGVGYPRVSHYYEYTSTANPTDLYYNIVAGNIAGVGNGIRIYSLNTAGGIGGIDIAANGNIGIANTTPGVKLEVTGDIRTSGSVTIGTGGTYTSGSIYSDANWGMLFRAKVSGAAGADFAWKSTSDANEWMRISNTGNVGIGTTSTSSGTLTVSGNYGAASGTFAGGVPSIRVTGSTSAFSEPRIDLGEQTLSPTAYIASKNEGNGGGSLIFGNRDTSSTSSTLSEKMRVAANGNIGIGTTSPAYKLDVNGYVGATRYNLTSANSTYAYGDGFGWTFTGSGYVYFNQTGTTYSQSRIIARSGISDDVNATLTLYGGTGGYTTISNSTRSPIFYDSDNTAYYLNATGASQWGGHTFLQSNTVSSALFSTPAYGVSQGDNRTHFGYWDGTNNVNYIRGVVTYFPASIQAPIFYDIENTAYYVNPNSSSVMSWVQADNWFRSVGQTGLYSQSYGHHLYAQTGGLYWAVSSTGSSGGFQFRTAYETAVRGYVYWDGTDNFGLLQSGGGWILRTWNSGVELYGSARSPIFYDSNDTGYYCDPNSYSSMYQMRLWGNDLYISGGSPTIHFQDTDQYSAALHNNSNFFYILRGGVNDTGWSTVGSGNWPMVVNLTNNDVTWGGALYAIYNIVAYASDRRLKENIVKIDNAIDKIMKIRGVTFDWKDKVGEIGFEPETKYNDLGVIAQEIQEVLPQAVKPAPFDQWVPDPNESYSDEYLNEMMGTSKSGENYLTVQLEKIVPLLIEGIKEQQEQIERQQKQIDDLINILKR